MRDGSTGRYQKIVTGARDRQVLCAACVRWLPLIGAWIDRECAGPHPHYHEACLPKEGE